MATSGSVYSGTAGSGGKSYFRVDWSRTSVDTSNNKSSISWTLKLIAGNYWYTNAVRIDYVKINGTTVKGSETYSNKISDTYTLASGSLVIPHNDDGTKSFTIELSGWFYEEGTRTGSKTFTLDAIQRGYKVEFNRNNGSYTPLGATTSSAIGFTTEAQSGSSHALSIKVEAQKWKTIKETFTITFQGENQKTLYTHTDTKCTTPNFDRWVRTVGGTNQTTYYTNPPSNSVFTITAQTNFAVYPKGASDNTITWEKGGTCNLTSVAQPKKASTKIENNFYTITFVNADSSMPQITNLPAPLKSYKIQSYTFDGWYDSDHQKVTSGTIDYRNTTKQNYTYTAQWTPSSAEYEQITLPFLSADDYTFLGWIEESNNNGNEQSNDSLDPEGKAQYYQGGQSFTPTKSMTLVPIWSKNAWVNISQIVVGAPEEITTTENVNFNINKLDINILKQLPAEIKPHAFYLLKTFSVCDNLDNPMPTGLYRYNGTVANIFNNSTSCYVLHFSMGYGNSSGRAQILIPHNASALLNNIYIRIYLPNDNAPLWTPWKTINLT